MPYPDFKTASLTDLPELSDVCDRSMSEVLLSRRTSWEFEETVDRKLISMLLYYTFMPALEVRERIPDVDGDEALLQILSLYLPFEVYLVVLRGDDIEPGVYQFSIENQPL